MLTIPDGLLAAARSLWDTTATLDTAKMANSEYLRAQVETIMRASTFDANEIDSDEVKAVIERRIFEPHPEYPRPAGCHPGCVDYSPDVCLSAARDGVLRVECDYCNTVVATFTLGERAIAERVGAEHGQLHAPKGEWTHA